MKNLFILLGSFTLMIALMIVPARAYTSTLVSDEQVKIIELLAQPLADENAVTVTLSTVNIQIQNVEIVGNWIGPIGECEGGEIYTATNVCFSIAKSEGAIVQDEVLAKVTFTITDPKAYTHIFKTGESGYANPQVAREDYGTLYELNKEVEEPTTPTVSQPQPTAAAMNSTTIILIGLSGVLVIAFLTSYISYRHHKSDKKKLITLVLVLLLAVTTLVSGYMVYRNSKDTLDTSVSDAGSCLSNSQCPAGQFCNNAGKCKPKRENNDNCGQDYQCLSGFCLITTEGTTQTGVCKPVTKLHNMCQKNEADCKAGTNTRWCGSTSSGTVGLCYPKQYKDDVNCVAAQNHLQVINRIYDVCQLTPPTDDGGGDDNGGNDQGGDDQGGDDQGGGDGNGEGTICSAMDVGVSATDTAPDGLITLYDFSKFAPMYNKNCTTPINIAALSCGSIDSDKNGKVDLPDFSKFATLFASKAKCDPVVSYDPNVCWGVVGGEPGQEYWPNGCKGAKPNPNLDCTQALVPLTSEERAQYNAWVAAGKPAIPGCNSLSGQN